MQGPVTIYNNADLLIKNKIILIHFFNLNDKCIKCYSHLDRICLIITIL